MSNWSQDCKKIQSEAVGRVFHEGSAQALNRAFWGTMYWGTMRTRVSAGAQTFPLRAYPAQVLTLSVLRRRPQPGQPRQHRRMCCLHVKLRGEVRLTVSAREDIPEALSGEKR